MSTGTPSVGHVTAVELRRWVEAGDPLVVLDVREDDERAFAAIPLPATVDDRHIPLRQVSQHLPELRKAARARRLVVYCHHGVRSLSAASWLSAQGIPAVFNLEGGIDAWSVEVDPGIRRY